MTLADRVRLQISEYGRGLSVVLFVAAIVCFGAAGYIYVTPNTETVTEQVNRQTFNTSVNTSSVVTGNTTLYTEGERLRDKPVYFTSAGSRLTFHVQTRANARKVNVSQRLLLVTRGVRDGRAFYTERRTLASEQITTTDGRVVTNTTINISRIQRSLGRLRAETQGIGTFRTRLVLNVTYQTERYSGRLGAASRFEVTDRAYWVEQPMTDERSHSETVQRTVTRPPDPSEYGGLSVAGALSLVGVAVVLFVQRNADPEQVRTRLSRSRHDDWISAGEIPTDAHGKDYVAIKSLEDLVDIAIDTNKRVIYDATIDTYAVIDSSDVYYFSPEESTTDRWLDL
jgi:hypothetical protein